MTRDANRELLTTLVVCAALSAAALFSGALWAHAQGVPSPESVPEADRLRVSYLGEVPRGAIITLRLADGAMVTGRIVGSSEEDVLTIEVEGAAWKVKGSHVSALVHNR